MFWKYKGHCAYCGDKLFSMDNMQVDHIEPIFRGRPKSEQQFLEKERLESFENKNPACCRCNRWKSTYSIEQFRDQIQQQTKRLKRDSAGYRLARAFQLIEETDNPVKFYFETCGHEPVQPQILKVQILF